MTNERALLADLEELVKEHGALRVTFSDQPGNSGTPFCATLGDKWPFSSHDSLEWVLKNLIATHRRLEQEALQKRIAEIELSSQL